MLTVPCDCIPDVDLMIDRMLKEADSGNYNFVRGILYVLGEADLLETGLQNIGMTDDEIKDQLQSIARSMSLMTCEEGTHAKAMNIIERYQGR